MIWWSASLSDHDTFPETCIHFVHFRNDTGHILCNTSIYIVGPLKQIGLGGSGSVDGAAAFPEHTFEWNMLLLSPWGCSKAHTAAGASTEPLTYCQHHAALLTAISFGLLLPGSTWRSAGRCTSQVPGLQVFVPAACNLRTCVKRNCRYTVMSRVVRQW
jgi:hypothetical protein